MLLFLSAAPLLVTQTVSSQSYTTFTSLKTVTNQVTGTSYSTFVAATTTQTSKGTLTYDYTFSIAGAACYYDYVPANFKAGDRIVGKVATNSLMEFFVMDSDQYTAFSHGSCGGDYAADVKASNFLSYSLNWVVPADGDYYFVFFNYAPAGQGAGEVIGTLDLIYPGSKLVTLALYSTLSGSNVFVTTETVGSLQTTTISPLFGWITANPPYLVLGIGVAVVIVGVLVISGLRARDSKRPKRGAQ